MLGIILFIVAVIMLWILSPIFIIYAIIRKIFNLKKLGEYFHNVAFSIDQLGNTMGAPIMNDFLLKKESPKLYGNPDETISHVTGVNYKAQTLTDFGYFVAHTLDALDPNHVTKAANNDQRN
jgi:hypothetical protein